MCGLAGIARHPQGKEAELAKELFSHLLLSAMYRGRQATGMSITCKGQTRIMKAAIAAHNFVGNETYLKTMLELDPLTTILMGHTRNATHNNGHVDEAAHPFRYGKIVGAHNGIITNYDSIGKELGIKFDVDSQAAFALLDKMKKAPQALAKLEGYFALTWIKGTELNMCRSDKAPTACAYVAAMKTLFWHSEMNRLVDALKDAGIDKEAHFFETRPEIMYRYDPSQFSSTSSNAVKVTCDLKGVKLDAWRRYGGITSGRQQASVTKAPTVYEQDDLWGDMEWNTALTTVVGARPKVGQESLSQLRAEIDSLSALVKAMAKYVKKLGSASEAHEAEIDFLLQRLDVVEDSLAFEGRVQDDESEDEEDDESPLPAVCSRCGHESDKFGKGRLLDYMDDELVHEGCLFLPEGVN